MKEAKPGESKDPYDTKLYHKFENVLGRLIKRRYLTLTSVVATLFLSLFIMSIMPQSFFPIMNKPYFRADLIFPEGYGIDDVERNVIKIEEYLKNNDKIKSYSFTLGGSPVRYYLASSSIGPKPNFANVLIETKDAKDAQSEENKFYEYMVANYPDILTRSALFALSPVPDAAIEIGFVGDNIDTLVALTQRAQEIARKNDMVMEVRNSWGNKVPVWKPLYSQEKGLRLGITRSADGLFASFGNQWRAFRRISRRRCVYADPAERCRSRFDEPERYQDFACLQRQGAFCQSGAGDRRLLA